jgi:hypothetical protein
MWNHKTADSAELFFGITVAFCALVFLSAVIPA